MAGYASMRAMGIILGLALHAAQAGGNEAARPDSSGHREPAMNLDFLIDNAADAPVATQRPAPHQTWIYWTAAGTAAACGGLGWYWYTAETKTPAPNRNYQVFTDAR